jgi:tRNA uridine 5-carboxymethylaminomethyl modification enzyme
LKAMFHVKQPDSLPENADPSLHGRTMAQIIKLPAMELEDVFGLDSAWGGLERRFAEKLAIEIKYDGYLKRQERDVARLSTMDGILVPQDFDYLAIRGIKTEAREKLSRIRPSTLGQAGRIAGVTPGDLALLYVFLKRHRPSRAA